MSSNTEEEYFAAEEIEKKRKLALQQAEEMAAKQKEERKALHFMKCPKCGMDLHGLSKGSVRLETCFNCGGTWLDKGELETMMRQGHEHTGGVIEAIFNLIHSSK